MTAPLQADIGLEVHVQQNTLSKLFCGCSTRFDAPPNTNVCPVCLGYPGALPVLNRAAVRNTVVAGLMLGCHIRLQSRFDRKSYFYPDMPKNYQISQYDRPLCEGGQVEATVGGAVRTIRVKRIHLEEDTGRNVHFGVTSGVDFNRAGTPLMEIVSEPDLHTPAEAMAYLQALKELMLYAGVSDCNLERGNFRCDVNVSVRRVGDPELGTKVELKNLNTFKGVLHALEYEIERQGEAFRAGERMVQETRRWDPDAGVTSAMRSKEDAHDYRYFPDPDLLPVELAEAEVEGWRAALPEAPSARRLRFVKQFGLPDYDAGVLVADRAVGDFFEAAAVGSPNPKAVSNWVMTELLRLMTERGQTPADCRLTPGALAELVALVDAGELNSTAAKEVFAELYEGGGAPREVVERRGLAQVSDAGALEALADAAIAAHPQSVEAYRGGKGAALQHLMGQVMKASRGRANPPAVLALLRRKLDPGGAG